MIRYVIFNFLGKEMWKQRAGSEEARENGEAYHQSVRELRISYRLKLNGFFVQVD